MALKKTMKQAWLLSKISSAMLSKHQARESKEARIWQHVDHLTRAITNALAGLNSQSKTKNRTRVAFSNYDNYIGSLPSHESDLIGLVKIAFIRLISTLIANGETAQSALQRPEVRQVLSTLYQKLFHNPRTVPVLVNNGEASLATPLGREYHVLLALDSLENRNNPRSFLAIYDYYKHSSDYRLDIEDQLGRVGLDEIDVEISKEQTITLPFDKWQLVDKKDPRMRAFQNGVNIGQDPSGGLFDWRTR